jgi:hypothetical protein
MNEAEWLTSTDSARMLALVRDKGSVRKLRLFALGCCQRVSAKITLPRSAEAIRVAELYAEGLVGFNDASIAREAVLAEGNSTGRGKGNWQMTAVALGALNGYDPQRWDSYANAQQASLLISDDYPAEWNAQSNMLRCVFGNPFCTISVDPSWLTSTVLALASQMYESRDFSAMPIIADALQDAGCESEGILSHCRQSGEHVRGCWVIDRLLGKE